MMSCSDRGYWAEERSREEWPPYKYVANRFLALFENLSFGVMLSEYHTGYRAFSRTVLEILPLNENSDDFAFDNDVLAQSVYFGFRIGAISCPTRYFEEASSINFKRSVQSIRFRRSGHRDIIPDPEMAGRELSHLQQ
jgi:hypothetical protein